MKILITNSSGIYGGGEYFTEKLAIELKNRGYSVYVACKKNSHLSDKLNKNSIESYGIDFPDSGTGKLFKNIKSLRTIVNNNRIDIIHSNTGYDRTAAAFATYGTKCKHITSCHSLESISHNLTHYIRNKYFTSHFIADGNSIKKRIVEENGIPEQNVTVVFNGINSEEMKRDLTKRKEIRNGYGIKEDEILIGTVGRLVEFKGYKFLLSAFKIISEKIPTAKLMIVGDGELQQSLKKQSEVLKISHKVIFAGFRDDLNAVYSGFDIYVNSSIKDGGELFPFSLLYAMAQGIPIVASRVGDIPVMINDGFNGFLVDEKSAFGISEKITNLIENIDIRQKFANNSINKLRTDFTLDKMTDKIENIYKKL